MSETMTIQPTSSPSSGLIARLIHENVVPQSGSTSFMYLYAHAMNSIGMKDTMMTAGLWTPIPATATMNPTVAARLYPGAVDATPMTTLLM